METIARLYIAICWIIVGVVIFSVALFMFPILFVIGGALGFLFPTMDKEIP